MTIAPPHSPPALGAVLSRLVDVRDPKIVIATRNDHKIEEIRAVLGPHLHYVSLRDLPGVPDPPETGDTFAENARLKAVGVANWLSARLKDAGIGTDEPARWMVLADDSGLEVDALHGGPGIHSARFAAPEFGLTGNAPDAANNAKLLRKLGATPSSKRTARFRCVLAIVEVKPCKPPSPPRMFEGVCDGRMGFLPRGANGFGYDPLFTPEGHQVTLAEMDDAGKNRISHRARALAALVEARLPFFNRPTA